MRERIWGWGGPIGVALLAFVLRIVHLGRPDVFAFDETYYAKDAYSLLKHGYVQQFVEGSNERILRGVFTGLANPEPAQIVHPEVGKWMIALGEGIFGMDPVGWRSMAALFGTLTVLVLARLVRRLTGKTWLGVLAGLLLALDGTHLVLSRLALLDVFLAFWLVVAVACLVIDRDRFAADPTQGWVRPWQLAAGVAFGLACGTKWSALYVLAAFGIAVVVWELITRRSFNALLVVGPLSFVRLVGVAFVVYVLTWGSFLTHTDEYEAEWGSEWGEYVETSSGPVDAMRSLWNYHQQVYRFHTGAYLESVKHPYMSNPAGWLLQKRPVSVDANFDIPADRCGAPEGTKCVREVLILGNPAVWWTGTVALIMAIGAAGALKSWRWAVPLLGIGATWLPWFQFADRPIFAFYAVATVPFLIMAICMVIDVFAQAATTRRQQVVVAGGVGALVAATVALAVWFWPVWTGGLLSYDAWHARMWFSTWI